MTTCTRDEAAETMFWHIRQRLVKQRIKRGLSQRDMAYALSVTPVHMCNLEKGNSLPSWETLYSWCAALGYYPQIVLRKR